MNVSPRAAARLRHGHVWVYRSDLAASSPLPPGSVVEVADEAGNVIGSAFYSSSSQIALRIIWSGGQPAPDPSSLVEERVRAAVGLRQTLVSNSNAYRLVFGEADQLPGIIADRYNDVLTVQFLTQGTDRDAIRNAVVRTLADELKPAAIVERVDGRIRELEHLPPRQSGMLLGETSATIIQMNGIQFHYDGMQGQKTGAFLDQRENYAAAGRYAQGEALDVFTYQGGFALHLAPRCAKVTAVDSSRPALEAAERNEQLNRSTGDRPEIEWIEGNAFDLLKDYATSRMQYDTIVLDPPAFAKTRRDLPNALRGYKELNLRAMKMLRSGGILVTCTCSHHVPEHDFLEVLRSAAADARRSPRILEKRGQAKDHPVLLAVPETSYLKCLILQFTA